MRAKQSLMVVFFISLFIFSLIPIVDAGVDQENTDHDRAEYVCSTYEQAQSFQPDEITLARISLKLKRVNNIGNLYVYLREDSPDGDTLTSWTYSQSQVPTSFTWIDFDCSSPLTVSTGTTYWIVLKAWVDEFTEYVRYEVASSDGDSYPDGIRKHRWSYFPGVWTGWDTQSNDLCFKTWEQNTAPTADFLWDYGTIPLQILVDGAPSTDDNGIVQYDWDWESDGVWDVVDGPVATSHQYPSDGTYHVSLRVTDTDGVQDVSTPKTVSFGNSLPVARISYIYTDLTITVNSTLSTDDDGSIVLSKWDWDGSNGLDWDNPDAIGVFQSNTYGSNGTYTITLQVEDNKGATNTASITQTLATGTSGGGGDDGNGGSSGFDSWGDWITLLMNLPTYVIILILAIVFIMAGSLAFFIKPEVIGPPGNLGVVPAVSTLFTGILAILAVILWYAEFEIYYILGCAGGVILILVLNAKYFLGGKK